MAKDLFDLASEISADDIVNESVKLLPHNQKLYNDIIMQLNNKEHSIFYSEGTGLGKSFVFMKLVQEYFKEARVLYIVPKIAIWNNVCHYKEFDYIADRVTLATFATFNRYPNNNVSCADYDVVFVDECHHMLSDVQGKNVKQFLDDMVSWDKHVLGMTATPEIEGIFVDEKCFDVSCYGLDMFEAIEQGLMPKMDIAIGIKEDIDIPDNLREQYSVVGTKTLLETVIDDYKHVTHWLAYFTTKEELEQNESELRKLFPEFKILKAYYGLDNTEEVIAVFENSRQPVILMTVSMFLEGMHLENVGGVLLYRNVQKGHTYAQILGRLCVIGQKYTPVIVDVPGSILTINKFYTPRSNRASESQRKIYERKDVFDITSRGYELLDLASELFPVSQVKFWSQEDILKLKSLDGLTLDEMAEELPLRSKRAIYQKAYALGLKIAPRFRDFSEDEIQIVRDNYAVLGTDCINLLENRTRGEITRLASKLGLHKEYHYIPADVFDDIVLDFKKGYAVQKLSDKYGIDKKIIKKRLDDAGYATLTVRRFSEEEKLLMRRLADEGMYICDIVEEINKMDCNKENPRTLGSVKSFLQSTGGYTRKIEYVPEETVKLICEAAKTCTISEIIQEYVPDYSYFKVHQILKRNGVKAITIKRNK